MIGEPKNNKTSATKLTGIKKVKNPKAESLLLYFRSLN
jgi:hypothetical protein